MESLEIVERPKLISFAFLAPPSLSLIRLKTLSFEPHPHALDLRPRFHSCHSSRAITSRGGIRLRNVCLWASPPSINLSGFGYFMSDLIENPAAKGLFGFVTLWFLFVSPALLLSSALPERRCHDAERDEYAG
ncbi:hypothetical protein C8J56DRAFT_39456 [Mycena floridula]|nr:hypothetical protein C8J56DRAFT_39456 [Mycena floridula]